MNDRELLGKLLAREELNDDEREAFADMLQQLNDKWPVLTDGLRGLSLKQRAWAESRFGELEPCYENLVSSGQVPRGREVQLLFAPGPLKPPRRA